MRKAEILILDDDEAVAAMLGEMLTLLGHCPTCCLDPVQALSLLGQRGFDLILSDFHMPGMEGDEFYRRLREVRPDLALRVIFLTGDVLGEETQLFLKTTGNPHLLKPFQFAQVREVVARALESHPAVPASGQPERAG